MSRLIRSAIFSASVMAMLVFSAAYAAGAEIETEVVDSAEIGEMVEIEVEVLDDAGDPAAFVRVEVIADATIIGEFGKVVLATAVTDEDGAATLEFLERAPADTTQSIEVTAHLSEGPVVLEAEIAVLPGPQLHQSDAPAQLPIFSVAWLFVVLGLVWAALLYSVWRMLNLGRAAEHPRPLAKLAPYVMVGFVIFTAAGMVLVLLNRPQSHANLEPGTAFERAPGTIVGEEHEYDGLGFDLIDVPQSELDGESLYELANCSGCHGIRGEGAVVGGALDGEILIQLDAFIGEVRRGPMSMPGYAESQIDDDALVRMINYLEEEG